MRKASWTVHPLFGVAIGLALAATFIAFQEAVSPLGKSVFGVWWHVIGLLLFVFFLASVLKMWLWIMLPTTLTLEPMGVERFAGMTEDALRATSARDRAPIPAIPQPGESEQVAPPLLDFARMEERTQELAALGFELQAEGQYISNRSSVLPNFRRMFVHAEGTWAELSQMFPPGMTGATALPVELLLITYLEDGWSVSETSAKPDWHHRPKWFLGLMLLPRALGKTHEPEISATEVWRVHSGRCAEIERALGVKRVHFDLDQFLVRRVGVLREVKRRFWKRSLIKAVLQGLFFPQTQEYWGDFRKLARNS